jgi:class 3 adenylate cyclase
VYYCCTGFTALSEHHAKQGAQGLDTLVTIINGYYTQLVNAVYAGGGDIIKIAGDALYCTFLPQVGDAAAAAASSSSPQSSTAAAAAANGGSSSRSSSANKRSSTSTSTSPGGTRSRHLRDSMGGVSPTKEQLARHPLWATALRACRCALLLRNIASDGLTLHVGVSSGELCVGVLGGVEDYWEVSHPAVYVYFNSCTLLQ